MPLEKIPSSQNVLRVGWVGTGPFSFYGVYTRVINNIYRDYNLYNMRITHIWGDDYSKNYRGRPEFVKKWLDFWADDEHSPEGHANIAGIPNVCSDFHDMVDEVDAALIMDRPSLAKFQDKVRAGGLMLINSSLIRHAPARDDIRVYRIPANARAEEAGDVRTANMVMLGALYALLAPVGREAISGAFRTICPANKTHLLPLNEQALEMGITEISRKQAPSVVASRADARSVARQSR